ncbi:MAG: hypothetical protein ABR543_18660 [Gemmatimonadaceae bacterium]
MPDHLIFGGILRSEIEFPELRRSSVGDPNWSLRVSSSSPPPARIASEVLGSEQLLADCVVRLSRSNGGFRLEYTDTGMFDVGAQGTDVVWYPNSDASVELGRIDFMGRVMAAALHLSGSLCLHGSAVALPSGGIAFLAPKHRGKSTLALALCAAAGRLLTDDTLPVDFGPPITLRPGVHSVRLQGDAANRLARDPSGMRQGLGGKYVLEDLPDERLALVPVPASALYELVPVSADALGVAARRTLLPEVQAALSLVAHTKIGSLLAASEAAVMFDRAVAVARAVPVYKLEVARDLNRIDEVVSSLLAWHEPSLISDSALAI